MHRINTLSRRFLASPSLEADATGDFGPSGLICNPRLAGGLCDGAASGTFSGVEAIHLRCPPQPTSVHRFFPRSFNYFRPTEPISDGSELLEEGVKYTGPPGGRVLGHRSSLLTLTSTRSVFSSS